MIVFLQLCILCVAIFLRGKALLGRHLEETSSEPGVLSFRRTLPMARRHVGLRRPSGIAFVIRRERWYHRVLKAVGIASEISLGDDGLDRSHFIATDHPGHLEQILRSGVLGHLRELFSLPVTSLHATPHRIWCVIGNEDVAKPDGYFTRHLELLREISEAGRVSSIVGARAPSGLPGLGLLALAAVVVHAGLLMLGLSAWLPVEFESVHVPNSRILMMSGMVLGAVAALIWFLALFFLFFRTSWISWVLVDFLLFGVAGFVLLGPFAAKAANTLLPQPPAQVQELTVVEKICVLHCMKGGSRWTTIHSYRFASARECSPQSREAIELQMRESNSTCRDTAQYSYQMSLMHGAAQETYAYSPAAQMFDSVETGSVLEAPRYPGALGVEWVDWNALRAR